jgi:hypothetical protein
MSRLKSEIARRLGYKVYDNALPQEWWNKMHSWLKEVNAEVTNPSAHYVWLYQDKTGSCGLMGVPGPVTSQGRNLLKLVEKWEDQEPVSPSLSGLHE